MVNSFFKVIYERLFGGYGTETKILNRTTWYQNYGTK